MEDMKEVIYSGPYTINNKPIILIPWSLNLDFSKEFPTKIPLWVKFTNMLKSFWGKDSLSRITSLVGVLVYVDECTAKQKRISYAWMLIEVNIIRTLPDEIIV